MTLAPGTLRVAAAQGATLPAPCELRVCAFSVEDNDQEAVCPARARVCVCVRVCVPGEGKMEGRRATGAPGYELVRGVEHGMRVHGVAAVHLARPHSEK